MNMFRFIVVMFFISITMFAQSDRITIIPKPQNTTIYRGVCEFYESKIFISTKNVDIKDEEFLKNEIQQISNSISNTDSKKNKSKIEIVLEIRSADDLFNSLPQTDEYKIEKEKFVKEGYQLKIEKEQIRIEAPSRAGLLYGIQSLKQLIKGNKKNNTLPFVSVIDWPNMMIRGVMDDISRGPVPTMSYMKFQIRRLAELKINMFMHYIEHVVKTKSHPKIAPDDGSITIEDIIELRDYAKLYNIDFIGSFQSFGHFNKILSVPEYKHIGEMGSLISPVKEESYEFLADIYSEMIPAFDNDYFNINCDETFDLGKGNTKQIVDSLGVARVYANHILRLDELVKKHNNRTMIWGDIILHHPEILDMLPKDLIMGTWNYDANENFDKYIDPFAKSGFDFIVGVGVLNSSKTMPLLSKTVTNIRNFIRDGYNNNCIGMLNTVWDDGGSALFSRDWYGVSYSAEVSWNIKQCYVTDLTDYNNRFNKGIYSAENNNYTKYLWKINSLKDLASTDALNEKAIWMNVIPESKENFKINTKDWDKVITICDEAKKLYKKIDLDCYSDEPKAFAFAVDQYEYFAKLRYGLISISKKHQTAESENDIDKKGRIYKDILNEVSDHSIQLQKIINEYERLWLRENRTHALNDIVKKYEEKLVRLNDIKDKILLSLQNIYSGLEPLSQSEVNLNITEISGKYFKDWMVINPIIVNQEKPLSVDYLEDMGGEASAYPRVTQEFYYNNKKYRWKRLSSPYEDLVKPGEIYKHTGIGMSYGHCTITANKKQNVTALIETDDVIKIILNGVELESIKSSITNHHKYNLLLKEGKNQLLIKTYNPDGDWQFSMQITDAKIRNSKNRYKIVE